MNFVIVSTDEDLLDEQKDCRTLTFDQQDCDCLVGLFKYEYHCETLLSKTFIATKYDGECLSSFLFCFYIILIYSVDEICCLFPVLLLDKMDLKLYFRLKCIVARQNFTYRLVK